ncbi:MAG: AzlC family ABC transporter permease [Clostridia bacterium]|nr:AzlC family ABC transporter permease [Clostridia bacterium]
MHSKNAVQKKNNLANYLSGLKTGIPIALGYFAVSLSLGISAKSAGLSPFQATLTSLLVNASAGEYAAFTLIAASASYVEIAIMEIIANARYFLMSCSLSQKFSPDEKLYHRLIVGFSLTDELFGATVTRHGMANPFFCYGIMTIAIPGWASGTCIGVLLGNALPANIVTALGVSLYGMFLAVIIPAARKNKIIFGLITVSMLASYLCTVIPGIKDISSGIITIILTLVISSAAAILFPVKEDDDEK